LWPDKDKPDPGKQDTGKPGKSPAAGGSETKTRS
jgi:hypothetical protein